MFNKTSR